MASGPVCAHEQAEHMAAPTNAANVKKVLANSEPSHTWHKADIPTAAVFVRYWSKQPTLTKTTPGGHEENICDQYCGAPRSSEVILTL